MIRLLLFVGAVALAIAQPINTLGAPPGGLSVYHAGLPPPHVELPQQRSGVPRSVGVPFRMHMPSNAQEFGPQADWNPLRWHGWHPVPGSLLYAPVWYEAQCVSNNALAAPWPSSMAPAPQSFTIGSLVDDRSQRLFSSPSSYAQALAASNTGGPETSGPLTFQYGLEPTPCGASDFFGL